MIIPEILSYINLRSVECAEFTRIAFKMPVKDCLRISPHCITFMLSYFISFLIQVTPINSYSDSIDWMRYLSLWESLSSDQQRVGELVGVSERFITLSHQGRKRRNTDDQQRLLQIHHRFYTALMLHDLVNEVCLQGPFLVADTMVTRPPF